MGCSSAKSSSRPSLCRILQSVRQGPGRLRRVLRTPFAEQARQGPTIFVRPKLSLRSYLLFLLFKLVVVDKDRTRLWICRFSAFIPTTWMTSGTVCSRAFACFCKRDNLAFSGRPVDKWLVMPKSSPDLSFDRPVGIWERSLAAKVMHCSKKRQCVVSPLKTRTWLTSTGNCRCYPQSCPMIVGRRTGRRSDGKNPSRSDLQKIF